MRDLKELPQDFLQAQVEGINLIQGTMQSQLDRPWVLIAFVRHLG